jgi:hypothetical protein
MRLVLEVQQVQSFFSCRTDVPCPVSCDSTSQQSGLSQSCCMDSHPWSGGVSNVHNCADHAMHARVVCMHAEMELWAAQDPLNHAPVATIATAAADFLMLLPPWQVVCRA